MIASGSVLLLVLACYTSPAAVPETVLDGGIDAAQEP